LTASPTLLDGPASAITATSATLSASLTPNGSAPTVGFQYSTDPAFTPTVTTVRYGTAVGFNSSSGVAVDPSGDVFGSSGSSVLKLEPDGTLITVGSGFSQPYALAVDASGNLFVDDMGTGKVQEVKTDGTISTIGSGFSGSEGIAVDASGDVFVTQTLAGNVEEIKPNGSVVTYATGFSYPVGVAVDASGDVFVANLHYNDIQEIKPGGSTSTVASGFNEPSGLAIDAAGDLFVADASNNAVKEIKPDGSITTVGSGFNLPTSVAVDASGNVYVGLPLANAVQEVKTDGSIVNLGPPASQLDSVAVDASGDIFFTDLDAGTISEITPNGPVLTIASGLLYPKGLAVDASGNLFVTVSTSNLSQGNIDEIKPDGSISVVLSNLPVPTALAFDASGNLFIVEDGLDSIVELKPDGTMATIASSLNSPSCIAVDAQGNVYFANVFGSNIEELTPGGFSPTTTTGISIGSGFSSPLGVAVDSQGNVFVANGETLQEVKPDGSITTIATGSGLPINGVAVDRLGDVFYTDPGDGELVELSAPAVPATAGATSSAGVVAESATLTGLEPGTTYYDRAIATGSGAIAAASNVGSFTTTNPGDLVLSASARPGLVLPGQEAIYTLTVTNAGNQPVTNATLIDALPAGSKLVNASPSQGGFASLTNGLLIDDLGTLAPGASATLTIVVDLANSGPATNLAAAAAPDDPGATPSVAFASVYVPSGPAVTASTASTRSIELTFDEPLKLTSARNKVNFKLFALGKKSRPLTFSDKSIAINTITYIPRSLTLTIDPDTPLIPGQVYELKLIGAKSGGLTDLIGRKLVGGPGQVPGTNAYVIDVIPGRVTN
jgi:uncharacterized repeat protein (TIGR01451 family)